LALFGTKASWAPVVRHITRLAAGAVTPFLFLAGMVRLDDGDVDELKWEMMMVMLKWIYCIQRGKAGETNQK
jgi:hypothetical protein